jgi:hypothetical protein
VIFTPSPAFIRVFKRGMKNSDVGVLQMNLGGLVVDGDFGPKTEAKVVDFQADARQHIPTFAVDGIAGGATQKELVLKLSKGASGEHDLPQGMLASICESETSFCIAAFTFHPSDSGIDLGSYQASSGTNPHPNQDWIKKAYDIELQAGIVATQARGRYEKYINAAHVDTQRRAWELAVLYWNWQTAAENLANLGRIYKTKPSDVPEAWIETATGGRLHTADEWVAMQIERKTVYVDWSSI